MFAILASAVNLLLGFLVRGVVVKFAVMFAAWFLALELISAIVSYLPSVTVLSDAMSDFPPALWYFLELARVDYGIPLMLSAFSTRFLIRRIPFVG